MLAKNAVVQNSYFDLLPFFILIIEESVMS